MHFSWFQRIGFRSGVERASPLILPVYKQLKAWRKAKSKMGWGIRQEEFDRIEAPSPLTERDLREGFDGVALFYGFGDDGFGNSDSVLSGKMAWDYARKRQRGRTWQCEYVDFDEADRIRLRPGAQPRPKGFYFANIRTGQSDPSLTVSQVRKRLDRSTGFGPEGIQLMAITHPHFQDMMNERKIPFMALADYDVAPYGFHDFFDAAQLFCSSDVFGLGIGNVDRNYPLFGIPTLRLQ